MLPAPRLLSGLVPLAFMGLTACQLTETGGQGKSTPSATSDIPRATVLLPTSEAAQTPSAAKAGCQATVEREVGQSAHITHSTFMADGMFLLQWEIDAEAYGSCKVDAEGNVVTLTTNAPKS